jgi:hypothetical protein
MEQLRETQLSPSDASRPVKGSSQVDTQVNPSFPKESQEDRRVSNSTAEDHMHIESLLCLEGILT